MSSQIVHVTDRKYMTKLQEKIKEDHLENLKKRIQEREVNTDLPITLVTLITHVKVKLHTTLFYNSG